MQHLIVPVDFSEATIGVIDCAANMALSFSARLWLLHVAPASRNPVPYNIDRKLLRTEAAKELRLEHSHLHDLAEDLRRDNIDAMARFIQGPVEQVILEEATRINADLIIMGSHGHSSVYHALLGGVSQHVLHKATCPVMLVPAPMGNALWADAENSVATEIQNRPRDLM